MIKYPRVLEGKIKQRQIEFKGSDTQDIINESISFLKDNLRDKGTVFVGFSEGKDSIVTADLMKRSGVPYQLYYSATGIDAPEVVRFIKKEYPDCEFLKPKNTFWWEIVEKNPPAVFSRWCCRELKERSSSVIPILHKVLGIRAEESSRRARYQKIDKPKKSKKYTHYYPILNWNEGEIWEYIEDNNLAYPSLYDKGLSRIGCVVCPFHSNRSGKGHHFYRERYPRFFKLFEKKCRQWYKERQAQGKEMFFDAPEEFIENWYKGNVQWYKRNEKGTDQMMFNDFIGSKNGTKTDRV